MSQYTKQCYAIKGRYMYKVNLFNVKLQQLDRLVSNTRLDFDKAYMIIFSDYPTLSHLNTVLVQSNIVTKPSAYSDKLRNRIYKTKLRLEKECF